VTANKSTRPRDQHLFSHPRHESIPWRNRDARQTRQHSTVRRGALLIGVNRRGLDLINGESIEQFIRQPQLRLKRREEAEIFRMFQEKIT
jgi:hypothetical protein